MVRAVVFQFVSYGRIDIGPIRNHGAPLKRGSFRRQRGRHSDPGDL